MAMRAAAALGLVATAWLAWPSGDPPAAWHPPAPPHLGTNAALAGAERLPLGGGRGPEDIAYAPDGSLYTGLDDGRILCRAPGGTLEEFENTGGRPLGLRFGPDGRLYVADAVRGLLAIPRYDRPEVLARGYAGRPFRLVDDLDIARDGTVYFTDASTRVGLGESVRDVVEQHATGRLFEWRPGGPLRLLHEGFAFANGVALAPDESFVLVVETARYRVQRCWLRGEHAGRCEVWIDNLPGFPDGITGGDGLYWVALISPRNALLDRIHPHPAWKTLMLKLPAFLRPGPKAYGRILAVDPSGRIVHDLQDPTGEAAAFVTNVTPHDGWLYLGSLQNDWIARVPAP
jgi:sugar lactone lactonase YvrE